MLPITGPIAKNRTDYLTDESRTCYTQKRPYNLPLEYTRLTYTGFDRLVSSEGPYDSGEVKNTSISYWTSPQATRMYDSAYNTAIERFSGKLTDTAGWAENLAQFGKARDMFVLRCIQMGQFAAALKRGNLSQAASILSVPKPSGASKRKKASQNLLEFEYGWKPLASDIFSTAEILSGDVPHGKVSAIARNRFFDRASDSGSDPSGSFHWREQGERHVGVAIRAAVRIENPDLFLAARVGLIDPALPWKLLPLSHVADWFANVGQFIAGHSGLLGLSIENPNWTWKGTTKYNRTTYTTYKSLGGVWHSTVSNRSQQAVETSRQLGNPSPTLYIKPFQGFSVQRGAQGIALVLAVLGR